MAEFDKKANFWAKFEEMSENISTKEELKSLLNDFLAVYVTPKYKDLPVGELPIYIERMDGPSDDRETNAYLSTKRFTKEEKLSIFANELYQNYAEKFGISVEEMFKHHYLSSQDHQDIDRRIEERRRILERESEQDEAYDGLCMSINEKNIKDILSQDPESRKQNILKLFSTVSHEYRHYVQHIAANYDLDLKESGKKSELFDNYKNLLGHYSKRAIKTIVDSDENITEKSFHTLEGFVKDNADKFGSNYEIKKFNAKQMAELGFYVDYSEYILEDHEIDARMFAIDITNEMHEDVSKVDSKLAAYSQDIIDELNVREKDHYQDIDKFYSVIKQTTKNLIDDEKFYDILRENGQRLENHKLYGRYEKYSQELLVKNDLVTEILNTMVKIIERDSKNVEKDIEKFTNTVYEKFVSHGVIFAADILKEYFDDETNKTYSDALKKQIKNNVPLTKESFYDICNLSTEDKSEIFNLCVKNGKIDYAQNIIYYDGVAGNANDKNQFLQNVLPSLEGTLKDGNLGPKEIKSQLSLIEDIAITYEFKKEEDKGDYSSINQNILNRFADINETLENLELQNSTNKEMTQYARKLEIESKQRQTQRAKEKQNNFKEYVDKNSFDFQ